MTEYEKQKAIVDAAVECVDSLALEPGVHYNIPMDTYNALPYMRSSGVKDMTISLAQYWQKHINPDYQQEGTDATSFGTAVHSYLLEPETFAAQYAIKPEGMSFSTKVGKAWKEAHEDKHIIKEEDMTNINRIQKAVNATGAHKYLCDGKAEVTLIWDEETTHGKVRCKARVDYLTEGYALDLKTFSNSQGMPVERCIAHAVARYKYHISAVWYDRGLRALNMPRKMFFMFIDTGGAPNVLLREIAPSFDMMNNEYWNNACISAQLAIKKHAYNKHLFGDKPWVDAVNPIAFSDNDFPLYMFEAENV